MFRTQLDEPAKGRLRFVRLPAVHLRHPEPEQRTGLSGELAADGVQKAMATSSRPSKYNWRPWMKETSSLGSEREIARRAAAKDRTARGRPVEESNGFRDTCVGQRKGRIELGGLAKALDGHPGIEPREVRDALLVGAQGVRVRGQAFARVDGGRGGAGEPCDHAGGGFVREAEDHLRGVR